MVRIVMRLVVALILLISIATPSTNADSFDSNGVNIHYTVTGAGDPVILIHGLYSNAFLNWQMPGIVKDLAKHYEVIAMDARGHGQSGKPTQDNEYGEQMSEDILRLMDRLQINKAHLVGYSMGGMIVMKFLATHPDRVSTAVLGGMGWLERGSKFDEGWARRKGRDKAHVPSACLRGISKLALSREEVQAIKVPITVIVGDLDPTRRLYIAPLLRIRPDIPVLTVKRAGHLTCVLKPQFKSELESALSKKN